MKNFIETFFTPDMIMIVLMVFLVILGIVISTIVKSQYKKIKYTSPELFEKDQDEANNPTFKYSDEEEIIKEHTSPIEIKKNSSDLEINDDEKEPLFDLKAVSKMLDEEIPNDKVIAITDYEKEQEEKAIISYDELLKNASSIKINYDDEESENKDVFVRKVNLEKVETDQKELERENKDTFVRKVNLEKIEIDQKDLEPENIKMNTSFYNYQKEEEFLKTLKQFRTNLNS